MKEANKRLRAAKNEQAALLKAHYAEAVPLELLKQEMERLQREIQSAENQLDDVLQSLQ